MSGKRPKKSQRLGSSRRGPRGLNRNNEEKDNDDGFPQIAESEDEQKESHSTTDNQSGDTPLQVQFDHLPNSSSDQPISSLECPPHAMSQSHKDAVVETELPERKRKMGSTRKKTGGFKVERKLKCEADDEMRTTEELCEEQLAQPITSAIEEDQSNLHEQSRSWILPSNLSQQTEGYGLGLELWATHDIEVIASKNKENVAIPHLEISSHSLTKDISSYEVESNMPMYMGHSVHLSAVTLTESGLLLQKQTPLDSTSSQKRKTGSTRRPHRGNTGEGDSENIEVQEHPSTERVEKVEVQAKFNLSGEMMQTWDDVVKGDSPTDKSSHTESAFISNQSFLSEKAKKSDVSAGTETNKQSVAFPVVDPAKPLPETPSYDGTPLLNENFDSKIGSEALSPPKSDNNALNTVIKEVESNLTDCNHDEPDIRSDKKTSQESRAVNTGQTKKEVLKQKKEPSRNYSMITLSSKQDTVSKELVLNDKESSSVPRQHHSATTDNNCDLSTDVLTIGGSRSSDKLESYIIHAEPTATDSPLEMSDTGPYIPTSEFAKKETFIRSSTSEQKRKKVSTLRKRMKYSKENLHVQASENFIEGIEINSETWQEKTWPKEMEENSASERDVSESSLYSANNKMVNLSSGTVHLHDSNLNFNNQFPEGSQFSCDAKAKAMVCSQSPESKINNEALHAHIGSTVEEGQERYFQMKPEKNTCDDNVSFREVKLIGDTIKVKRNVTNQSDFLQNDTPIDRNQEALKLSENVENVSTVTDSDLLLRYLDTVCSREAEIVPEKTELNINPEDSHRLELHSVLNPVAHKRKMGSIRRPLGGNKGQRKGKEHHNDNETLNSESISNREVEIIDMEDDHGPDKSTLRTSETKDGTTVKDREKFVENKAGPVEGIDSDHMSSSCSSDIQASTAVGISDILEEQTLTGFCAETLENSGDVEEVPVGEDIEPHLDIQTQNITFDSTTNEGERTEENIHDVSVLVKPTEVIGDIIAVKSNVTIDSDFHQNDTPIDRNQEALNVENVSTVTDSGLSLRDVDTVGSREADTVPEKTEININPEDSHRLELHSILNPVAHKRKMGSTRRPLGGNKDQRKGKENHNDNEKLNSESIRNKEVEIFDMEDGHGPDKSTLRTSETKDGTTVK
ncbi:uncharacterized protein LOC127448799 [Myxocyprinus asiaticus]|uniref:uncharacterized protein LOC127448799 n=1 Tax=Myxocyprinus asiaticus TaxID=70543 RepID=UPI0022228AA0|nr:uncharacterized protein LOC127448799 [Myxocyprinus asiaticus]